MSITTACVGLIDLSTQLGELTLLNEKNNAYFIEIASFSHDMNEKELMTKQSVPPTIREQGQHISCLIYVSLFASKGKDLSTQ